jgi:hypothetical protein
MPDEMAGWAFQLADRSLAIEYSALEEDCDGYLSLWHCLLVID